MPATPPWRSAASAAASAAALAAMLGAPGLHAEESGSGRGAATAVPGPARHAARSETLRPQPVGIMINRRLTPHQALVVTAGGTLFVRRADLAETGLALGGLASAFVLAGQDYVSLAEVEGLSASLGGEGSVLDITAAPAVFPQAHFTREAQTARLDEIVPAAFIGYDLSFVRWNGRSAAFAFLDAGVSADWGLIGSTAAVQSNGHTLVRLDSAFQRDWPDARLRLVVGDTVTRATEWSAGARFAGIRLGTDFALQPTLVTFPLPRLAGSATLPSAIDLVSASSRQSLAVGPGVFAIDYQPVFSGAGEVTMMITDANGLSRQVTSSFYTSPRLLRPGLADFSLEAGVIRKNYGIASFDYGAPFAAGFLRLGLSDVLTLGGRLEASPDIVTGGLGIGWVLPAVGEFGLAGAVSDGPLGRGTLWRAQFQRIAPAYAFTLSYQQDNGRFAQVGSPAPGGGGAGVPRRELALAGSLSLGTAGDIVVGHAQTRTAAGQTFRTTSLTLNGAWGAAFYSLGLRHNRFSTRDDQGAFLSVSMPLGLRSSAGLRVDEQRTVATIALAPPTDSGAGYQVALGHDRERGEPIVDVAAQIRTAAGELELAGGRSGGAGVIRLGARGAVVAAGGSVVATPRLENAFALVALDSAEDVTLYLENRPVVAKGGAGRTAILTGLQPYAPNRIAIDVAALPITADVEAAEKLVVPGFRQAARVSFGGAAQSPASVRLRGPDGKPLPPGLEIRSGSALVGITGYDGLFFLPDVRGAERLEVGNSAFRCEAQIPPSPQIDANRQLAPLDCLPARPMEQPS